MHQLLHFVGLAASLCVQVACLVVLVACICRIDQMRSNRNAYRWFFIYALFAVFSLGVAQRAWRGWSFDWNDGVGIVGLLLLVLVTRRQWKHGPPPETERGGLE